MSDMKPISFVTSVNEQEKEKLIQDLLKSPYVQKMMEHNHLPEEAVKQSPWTIKRWLENYVPCMQCRGLAMCGQKDKGYYDNLCYDGLLQIEKRACQFKREKEAAETHLKKFLINDMPEGLYSVSYSTIKLENESAEYMDALENCMCTGIESPGIYLYGSMGTGKTYLAACAANEAAKAGKSVAFIHYPTFCERMVAMISNGEYRTELNRMFFAQFAVIDDIGAESVSEWNRDQILFPILSKRYDASLPTWFTSNEDIETLKKHFSISKNGKIEMIKGERILERVTSLAKVQSVPGKDRRI